MGNIVNTVKRLSSSYAGAIPLQRCSYLPSNTSSLDKCPCVNDTSVIGSIASATKGSIIGSEAFSKEVGNEEIHPCTGSTSGTGCLGDINCSALPMADTDPAVHDEANREIETQNGTTHTDAREHGCFDHSDKSGLIYNQIADHTFQSLEDESTQTPRSLTLEISGDILNKVAPEENCSTNPDAANDLENGPAIDTRKSKELSLYGVSPADSFFDRNISQELIGSVLNFGCGSTPEASLKVARHKKRMQKGDIVPIEIMPACATSYDRSSGSNPKASLKG
ncbi:hypothetical protein ACP70R_009465 [Stipagrostis hirtigluma subsp. patula]